MKKKYVILANSIKHNISLNVEWFDFTDEADMDDDDILHALSDACNEYEQFFMNTIILTEEQFKTLKQ